MKKLLLFLSICTTLFSCSKNNPDVPNTTPGTSEISYDFNGKHYAYVGEFTDKWTGFTRVGTWGTITQSPFPGAFVLTGGNESGDIIVLSFLPDSIAAQLSNYKAGCNIVAENINYTVAANDLVNIKIASFQNDVINGSFSGTVTTTSGATAHGTVTKGLIKNVKIHY